MYPRCAQQKTVAKADSQRSFADKIAVPGALPYGKVAVDDLQLPVAPRGVNPTAKVVKHHNIESSQIIEPNTISEIGPDSPGGAYLPSRRLPSPALRTPPHKVKGGRLADMLVSQTNKSLYISAASPTNISQHFAKPEIDSGDSIEMEAATHQPSSFNAAETSSQTSSDSPQKRGRDIDDAAVSCLMTQYFVERGIAGTLKGDSELLWADDSSIPKGKVAQRFSTTGGGMAAFMGSPNDPLLSGSSDESSSKNWLDVDHFPGMAAAEDFGHLSKESTNRQAAVINLLKSRSPTSHDSSGRPSTRGRRTTAIFGQP